MQINARIDVCVCA